MSSTLSGHISYNRARRKSPDRRSTRYNLIGENYVFQGFGGGNGHFFSDQEDNYYEGALKYEFNPIDFVRVSADGNAIVKDRFFTARRISYLDQIAPYLSTEEK